jgi:hypothetical protein
VGGITGPTAAAAEVYAIRRDRPRLVVNFGYREPHKALPQTWLTVLNDGRQPVTVREAGFYGSEMPIEILSKQHGKLFGTATYQFKMIDKPILLDPGVVHEATAVVPDAPDNGYHVDFPLRAYAVDARGRRVWGEAAPIVRMIFEDGPCPPELPSHLWNKTHEPLQPARVEPKWKLWKKRELRRGEPGRLSADELEASIKRAESAATS